MPSDTWTIAITGASGMIGSALRECLQRSRAPVHVITPTRHRARVDATHPLWSPADEQVDAAAFEGVDVVVHLAGEPIAATRWTDAKKRRIHRSRVIGTELLADALARCNRRPRVFIQPSAVGYYGDAGEQWLDEGSPRGDGFLARICELWEAASRPAEDAGIRVVRLRLGHVLGEGGLLAALRPAIRYGLLARFGSGEQFWSWIAMHDLLSVMLIAMSDPRMHGVYNVTSPDPVRNRDFIATYAEVLGRRPVFPVPAPALRLGLGRQQADEMLLFSQRVLPARLHEHGVALRETKLEDALRRLHGERLPLPTEAVPATIPATA